MVKQSPSPEQVARIHIYEKTQSILEDSTTLKALQTQAQKNMNKWSSAVNAGDCKLTIDSLAALYVVDMDMLDCAHALSKHYGTRFAVLNVANPKLAFGGVRSGRAAPEEDMARRTSITKNKLNDTLIHTDSWFPYQYTEGGTNLLNGRGDRVALGLEEPSVCFRTSELRCNGNVLGYELMADSDIFEFYELRASAVDMHHLRSTLKTLYPPIYMLDEELIEHEIQKRIKAQFNTLKEAGLRHVVLTAFGCGEFENNPKTVASAYANILQESEYRDAFSVIAFAIPLRNTVEGYNSNTTTSTSYEVFKQVFNHPPWNQKTKKMVLDY